MEYRQSLKSLVPDRVTLKADTEQYAFRPPPFRTPDILTGSRVNVMTFPRSGGSPETPTPPGLANVRVQAVALFSLKRTETPRFREAPCQTGKGAA